MAIWQDLVDDHGFPAGYASVRRFVSTVRQQPTEARVHRDGEARHRDRALVPAAADVARADAEQVRITNDAVEAVICGYTREAAVWHLGGALGALCAKVVRRRAEGTGTMRTTATKNTETRKENTETTKKRGRR